jgi:predicted GNAT family acetyltransferase
VLFTGLDNLPARRAYGVLGFRPLGDYRLVLLRHRA